MADKKISELNSVSLPLSGTEVIPIVQGGETKKITADDLKSDRLSNDIADYTTATLPLSDTDKLLINQGGTFKEVAKSELDKQKYFTFSTNTTLTNSHHNAVIWVTATCNITIPSGLRSDFNATFRTFAGAIATFLTSGTTISSESDGTIQSAKSMSYVAQFSTNNYIISGGGLS